jgi:hypothetical protein
LPIICWGGGGVIVKRELSLSLIICQGCTYVLKYLTVKSMWVWAVDIVRRGKGLPNSLTIPF